MKLLSEGRTPVTALRRAVIGGGQVLPRASCPRSQPDAASLATFDDQPQQLLAQQQQQQHAACTISRRSLGAALSAAAAATTLGAGPRPAAAIKTINPMTAADAWLASDEAPRFVTTPGGVRVQQLAGGTGRSAAPGDRLLIDYVLRRSNGYFIYGTVEVCWACARH